MPGASIPRISDERLTVLQSGMSARSKALFTEFDERGKNAALMLLARRQGLRVPLHAENKAVLGAFDSFNHAVIRDGVDDKAAPEAFHRLVMAGIHFKARTFHDVEKAGARLDVNGMTAVRIF